METKRTGSDQHVLPAVTGLALASLLVIGILTGTAIAASGSEYQEATALDGAAVTLSQAVVTAEQHTGGQAFDASVNTKGAKPRIVVETNGPMGVQTIDVDAQNGQVVGAHAGSGAS